MHVSWRTSVSMLALLALLACGEQPSATPQPGPSTPRAQNSQAFSCDPEVKRIPIGDHVYDISVGEGAVWLLVGDDRDSYFVRSIDPESFTVTDVRTSVGGPETSVFDIAAGEGAVWVPLFTSPPAKDANVGKLLRIDPRSAAIVSRTSIGKRSLSATTGNGSVWLTHDTNDIRGEVLLLDPRTERVSDTIRVGRVRSEVMLSDGAAWIVTGEDGDHLIRIDRATHATTTVWSDRTSYLVADGAVWFADEGGIGRYDLASKETGSARVSFPVEPYTVIPGHGTVWLSKLVEQAEPSSSTAYSSDGPGHLRSYRVGLARLDPVSLKPISDTILLDEGAESVRAADFGADGIWVPSRKNVLHVSLRC